MKIVQIILGFLAVAMLSTCDKNTLDTKWKDFEVPKNFPTPAYEMKDNPITQAGFELGRKLFYDPILSRDNTISCGSCHIQGSAFTHHGHDLSHGIDDKLGKRNALPIQNLLWQSSYFWDGGVHNLDMISINPMENPVEMDEKLANVMEKLKKHSEYPTLFKKAFGSEEVNSQRFLQAMSQFMAMLVSANSKYDKYIRNEGVIFTEEEKAGLDLFKQKCASCHKGELFSDFSFRNNGILKDFSRDKGRYEISLLDSDIGKFKVPSLRNIEKTPPYMHNGVYLTLESVLEHYNSEVKPSTTLDSTLIQGSKYGIPLSQDEKTKIVAFLKTLTDETFIRDSRFAEQ